MGFLCSGGVCVVCNVASVLAVVVDCVCAEVGCVLYGQIVMCVPCWAGCVVSFACVVMWAVCDVVCVAFMLDIVCINMGGVFFVPTVMCVLCWDECGVMSCVLHWCLVCDVVCVVWHVLGVVLMMWCVL